MTQDDFEHWLISSGYRRNTAYSYSRAINRLSTHYSQKMGRHVNIYNIRDLSVLAEIRNKYRQHGIYSGKGDEGNGTNRAAITKYRDYVEHFDNRPQSGSNTTGRDPHRDVTMKTSTFSALYCEDLNNDEYARVLEYAHSLLSHINSPEIVDRIAQANQKGASSGNIQACLLDHLQEIGFHTEKRGLFDSYLLRPDYYLELTPNRGILLEVEKGKTLTNNMDMLDLWKCHICNHAQYLFLVVPIYAQNAGSRNVFGNVVKRMEPFFDKKITSMSMGSLFLDTDQGAASGRRHIPIRVDVERKAGRSMTEKIVRSIPTLH